MRSEISLVNYSALFFCFLNILFHTLIREWLNAYFFQDLVTILGFILLLDFDFFL